MLLEHYAPRTPSQLWSHGESLPSSGRWGLLSMGPQSINHPSCIVHKTLSPTGDLSEAAHNLFGALRELDLMSLDLILVERCSEVGIGVAIMDRLRRATARTMIGNSTNDT